MDLLDFYRGSLSYRLLKILIRQLPAESALARVLNDGEQPWRRIEHLMADVWSLWAKKDHPVRVKIEAKAKNDQKLARVIELRTVYEKKKRAYGLA